MGEVRAATAPISSSLHCSTQHAASLMAFMYVQLLCAQRRDEMINRLDFNKRCSFMVMRGLDLSELCALISGSRTAPALFSLLSVTSHPYHTLTPYRRFTSSSLFFSYQLATQPRHPHEPHPPHSYGAPPSPFWELSQCRCLGSKAQRGWQDSRRRCLGERCPPAAAAGTWRLPLSPEWHHGSALTCTENKYGREANDDRQKVRRGRKSLSNSNNCMRTQHEHILGFPRSNYLY